MKALITITVLTLLASCGKQSDIDKLNHRLDKVDTEIDTINTRVNTYIDQVNINTNAIGQHKIDIEQLELNLEYMSTRIDELGESIQIKAVRPACEGSYEMVIELTSGELLAYFEQGSNRYLTVLKAGTYRTTDRIGCTFTIE